jgi:hypothetical protein
VAWRKTPTRSNFNIGLKVVAENRRTIQSMVLPAKVTLEWPEKIEHPWPLHRPRPSFVLASAFEGVPIEFRTRFGIHEDMSDEMPDHLKAEIARIEAEHDRIEDERMAEGKRDWDAKVEEAKLFPAAFKTFCANLTKREIAAGRRFMETGRGDAFLKCLAEAPHFAAFQYVNHSEWRSAVRQMMREL